MGLLKELLDENPEYDGRGILIAIIDTGVDPSSGGLQITSTGIRKIVDCIDCTGANDVCTKSVREIKQEDYIEGVTGRKLKVPSSWINPSNKYHVGMKPIMEFFGGEVAKDLKTKLNKELAEEQKKALDHALSFSESTLTNPENGNQNQEQKWKIEDRNGFQRFLGSSWMNHGPVSDCIVWHNGEVWQACMDTSFCGDLESCKVMSSYKHFSEYDQFALHGHEITYSFRISADGDWLQIVVSDRFDNSHGTVMASIAAAHYPAEKWKNGCAPGAQLLSLRVVDSARICWNSAFTKALQYCVKYGVNYSYSSKIENPNTGPRAAEIGKFVRKTNVLFMSSTGNDGPSLFSLSAEASMSKHIFGVAAHMSGQRTKTFYHLSELQKENISVFSSRGPSTEGALGISFCAPSDSFVDSPGNPKPEVGGGSSSASAYASGALACLLSGLQALNLSWTRYQIQLAIENTARTVNSWEMLSQGNGMIQVSDALDYFRRYQCVIPNQLEYIRVNLQDSQKTGLIISDACVPSDQKIYTVQISAVFKEKIDVPNIFKKYLCLSCDAKWVRLIKCELLLKDDQYDYFDLQVCTKDLQPNQVYFTEVLGNDAAAFDQGPFFRFPITVIMPYLSNSNAVYSSSFVCIHAVPKRVFLSAPANCNLVEVSLFPEIKENDDYCLSVAYLQDKRDVSWNRKELAIKLDKDDNIHTFTVKSGKVIEICLTRHPSNFLTPIQIYAKFSFYGVSMSNEIIMDHNVGSLPVTITNSMYRELEISPQIAFRSVRTTLNPISSEILSFGVNDANIDGVEYSYLQLDYAFTVYWSTYFTVQAPGFYLSDLPVSGLSMQVFNANKKYINDATHGRCYIPPGKYILQVQVKDSNREMLESLRQLPLFIDKGLTKPIIVTALNKRTLGNHAVIESDYYEKHLMEPAREETVFFGGINKKGQWIDNWNAPAGSYLMGTFKLADNFEGTPLFEKTVKYYLSNDHPHTTSTRESGLDERFDSQSLLDNSLKSAEYEHLRRQNDSNWTELFSELKLKYPSCIKLTILHLEFLYNKKKLVAEELLVFRDLSKKMLEQIKPEILETSERSLILKMRAFVFVDYWLAQKKYFVPTLFKPRRIFNNHEKCMNIVSLNEMDQSFIQFQADELKTTQEENWLLECKHASLHDHWGRALGYLTDWEEFLYQNKKSMKEQDVTIAKIFENCGWPRLAEMFRAIHNIENRQEFRPFQGNMIPE